MHTDLLASVMVATVAWPQDDSYRGHVDAHWLRVLGSWITRIAHHPPLSSWRHFYVLALGVPGVTLGPSALP